MTTLRPRPKASSPNLSERRRPSSKQAIINLIESERDMRSIKLAIFTVFILFAFKTQALSQTSIELDQALTGETRSASAGAHYRYLFENPRFTTPVQELDFDGAGHGKFRF